MAGGLEFRIKGDCTIYVAKTKALISFAVTAKLICVFVFACAKGWFSHDADYLNLKCKLNFIDQFSEQLLCNYVLGISLACQV